MNVWIVNPFDNLPSEGNRPQRYWLMAEAFVRAGHRVVYWTSDFSHATKRKRAYVGRLADGKVEREGTEIDVVQIPTVPYGRNICWARVRSHRKLARDFERMALAAPRPSLVIASTPPLGLCEAALRVARKVGARFVADVQDAWPETFERVLPRWVWSLAGMRAAAKRIYCGADGVSAVAKRYVELAQRRGSVAPMRVFGHCIDQSGDETTEKWGGAGRTRLAYAGNMSLSYDLETLIRAVQEMEGVTLDIAGNGPDRNRLVSLVRGDSIRFHGYLGGAALAKLLRECDVGVVPMWPASCVGVPGKLADYAAAGLRVIESLGGECREIVEKYGVGVHYEAGNAASLKAAIRDVVGCGERADQKGFAGHFDARAVMDDYVKWTGALKFAGGVNHLINYTAGKREDWP